MVRRKPARRIAGCAGRAWPSVETGAAEPQAVGARRIGSEPFGVDVEDEEDCAVLYIGGNKLCGSQGLMATMESFHQQPPLIAHVDVRRRSTDMKNQMPFAMRMHVEGAVQLIKPRSPSDRTGRGRRREPCSCLPSRGMFLSFSTSVQHPPRDCRGKITPGPGPSGSRRETGTVRKCEKLNTSCTPERSGSAARSWRIPPGRNPRSGSRRE